MSKPATTQEQWIEDWARRVQRSGLAVVALPLLELGRGLGFLAGQALLLAQPLWSGLVNQTTMDRYVTLLEDPATVERLIERIEREADCHGR